MSVETVTYISDLDYTQPLTTDQRKQGDDHLRNIKLALRQTFPNITGPVTATQAELNSTSANRISVKDAAYGAVGNGVTNDTAAIAAAITAAASPGGTVIFPGATSYLATLPTSYPTVVLEYDGPKTAVNVYQQSGETSRWGKKVYRGQNATTRSGEEYSLFVVEHHPVGSGTNGPTSADYALTVVNQKQDFTSTSVVGETDGILIVVRNGGATSDGAGILANIASYGTGFMAAMEATTSIISGVTTQQSIQTQVGVVDNVSPYYLGFYTRANTGALHNAFRADTSAAATWDYLFRGYQNGVEKFSVTGIGKINLFDSAGNKKSLVVESNALNMYANDGATLIFQCNNSGNGAFLGSLTAGLAGFGGAGTSASTNLNLPAATTSLSSLRLAHGAAPTAPVNGDMWTTTAGLFVRINGATVGPLS